jgi:hypothetical protein
MKNYRFIFEDRKGNELDSKVLPCVSKREAIQIAKRLFAESKQGDLYAVKSKMVK